MSSVSSEKSPRSVFSNLKIKILSLLHSTFKSGLRQKTFWPLKYVMEFHYAAPPLKHKASIACTLWREYRMSFDCVFRIKHTWRNGRTLLGVFKQWAHMCVCLSLCAQHCVCVSSLEANLFCQQHHKFWSLQKQRDTSEKQAYLPTLQTCSQYKIGRAEFGRPTLYGDETDSCANYVLNFCQDQRLYFSQFTFCCRKNTIWDDSHIVLHI